MSLQHAFVTSEMSRSRIEISQNSDGIDLCKRNIGMPVVMKDVKEQVASWIDYTDDEERYIIVREHPTGLLFEVFIVPIDSVHVATNGMAKIVCGFREDHEPITIPGGLNYHIPMTNEDGISGNLVLEHTLSNGMVQSLS